MKRPAPPISRPFAFAIALRRLSSVLVIVLALGALSCHRGTRPANFPPALGPQGASVVIRLQSEPRAREGELFAVDSIGMTVLAPNLVRVAWASIRWAEIANLGYRYDVIGGVTPDAEKLARIALVSRFPQGLSDELLARLFTMLPQQSLEEIR